MLFGHTRYKKSKKTLPLSRNRHVKLSWNRKNPHRQRVLDLSPPPLDDACSTYIHACSTYIHAQHTYIHAQHTYIHAQHTCIHTYLLNSCAAYICMSLCMYVCIHIHTCLASEASEAPKSRYPAWTKKIVQTFVSVIVLKHSREPGRNLIFFN